MTSGTATLRWTKHPANIVVLHCRCIPATVTVCCDTTQNNSTATHHSACAYFTVHVMPIRMGDKNVSFLCSTMLQPNIFVRLEKVMNNFFSKYTKIKTRSIQCWNIASCCYLYYLFKRRCGRHFKANCSLQETRLRKKKIRNYWFVFWPKCAGFPSHHKYSSYTLTLSTFSLQFFCPWSNTFFHHQKTPITITVFSVAKIQSLSVLLWYYVPVPCY